MQPCPVVFEQEVCDVLEPLYAAQGTGALLGRRRKRRAMVPRPHCPTADKPLGPLEELQQETQLGAQVAGGGADCGVAVPLEGEPVRGERRGCRVK